jgi:galactokinase/mevalonate kinase-like predicted kinase
MLISAALGAGAHAVKACGAGGGGWLVFMVDDGTREAVEASLRSAGGRLIDVGIDVDGALILG